MEAATGIKPIPALGTYIGSVKILLNGQFGFADRAKYGPFMVIRFGPGNRGMISQFLVARKTRIIFPATFKPYGNDIEWGVIMHTSGLVVNCFSFYHRASLRQRPGLCRKETGRLCAAASDRRFGGQMQPVMLRPLFQLAASPVSGPVLLFQSG